MLYCRAKVLVLTSLKMIKIKRVRRYNLRKSEDVQDAYWDDDLLSGSSEVLHEMVKLDKERAKNNDTKT